MYTIEEAKLARETVTFNIPAAAAREFGEDAIKRAIEEQIVESDRKNRQGMRDALLSAWHRLVGATASASKDGAVKSAR